MKQAVLLSILVVAGCSATMRAGDIHEAARDGDLAAVKRMIEANPEAILLRDGGRMTALHWAAMRGHTEIIELLLAAGSDVNARDQYGCTPLLCAVKNEHTAAVALLLDHGADVDIKDRSSDLSVLHWAVLHRDVAALLLDGGADPTAADARGFAPLDCAMRGEFDDVAALLRDHIEGK